MSKRLGEDYLKDILEATEAAIEFLADTDFETFQQDKKTIYAVTRAIQIIGEAVKKVPNEIKVQHTEVPWKDIAGMRDKITHQYFAVRLDIVWATVKQDLPTLKRLIINVIDNLKE
ncbi:MAG: hypothetical protein N5P05_004116 (plasmid) [Chroococcopsis gigantea SAG 12.99]|jgi:uncharacterized protein with HEPN domain|nr:hypothetical protein [Chroococcopsis gigantea SAG 12.99]